MRLDAPEPQILLPLSRRWQLQELQRSCFWKSARSFSRGSKSSYEANLIEAQWFIAKDLELPSLFFTEFSWNEELDHNWHEFQDLEETDEEANREEDIRVFLERLAAKEYGSLFD